MNKAQLKTVKSGNKCGHNTHAPRLSPLKPISKGPGGLPRILSLAAERSKAWYDNYESCPELNSNNKRKTRSERREAIVIIIETLLKYLELSTLMVGIPRKHGFVDIDMKTIIRESGLGKRRCERAIHNLKKAGFLKVHQPRLKKAPGKYVALRAVRMFTANFFDWLDLKGMLKKETSRAALRNAKKLIKTIKKVANPITANGKIVNQSSANNADIEFKRKWHTHFYQLLKTGIGFDEAQINTNKEFNLPKLWSPGQNLPQK